MKKQRKSNAITANKKPKTKRRHYTDDEIREMVKNDFRKTHGKCPPGVTPVRLYRTMGRWVWLLKEIAMTKRYPDCVRFKHLFLDRRTPSEAPERPSLNFWIDQFGCNLLDLAIRHHNLPADTTKKMLEQSTSMFGTGWDALKRTMRMPPPSALRHRSREALRVKTIRQFPELLSDYLLKNQRIQYEKFLSERRKETEITDSMLLYLLQIYNDGGVDYMLGKRNSAGRKRLLRLCLRRELPPVDTFDQASVEHTLNYLAADLAAAIVKNPGAADVLDPADKLHAKIINKIMKLKLSPATRQRLAKYPALCAAML